MTDKEKIKKLEEENKKLKKQLEEDKKKNDYSAWDFHYSGHGDYFEEQRCFYGDFS